MDGVLRITRMRIRFRALIPSGTRDKAQRALEKFADKCPAYQSVKGCIDVSWDAEWVEQ